MRSVYPPARPLKHSEDLEDFRSRTAAGEFDLDVGEKRWRDRSALFEAHGYRLRPRFRKDWKPSWLGTNLNPRDCEDFYRLISTRLIDATRISDEKRVVLKRVRRGSTEIGLAQSLNSGIVSEDPDNHCVPILEYFDDLEDDTLGFLVMPLLRRFDNPKFAFISEVVDFVHQTLTGLRYLHRKKIAHRDLSGLNIMMDGNPLYPTGFHPSHQTLNPVATDFAIHLNRRDVPSIKYYIIDFGNSSAFDNEGKIIERFKVNGQYPDVLIDNGGISEESEGELDAEQIAKIKARLHELDPNVDLEGIELAAREPLRNDLPPFMVTGRDALDREVPELSTLVPYDPFLVDIFTLGNVYKKIFLQTYANVEFLSSLADSMTQKDPKMRPSIDEAIEHFESVMSDLGRFQLCLPLRLVETPLARYSVAVGDMKATIRESWILARDRLRKLLLFSWFRQHGSSGGILRFRRSPASN